MKKLRPQWEKFCQEYAICHNITEAAKRAKYSDRSAYSQGNRLMKDARVIARISELEKIAADAAGVTLQKVVDRLAQFAFSDIDALIDNTNPDNPRIKGPLELDEEGRKARGAIQEITVNKNGGTKFKMYSAQAALETLKSILTGPSDIKLQLSGEVIQKIERVVVDPKKNGSH